MSASENPGPISRRVIEALCKPQKDDAVLGGHSAVPSPLVLVLGTGKLYAKLFDRFNSEATRLNPNYFRLKLSHEVALIRARKLGPLEDIKVKVLKETVHDALRPELSYTSSYWAFAGWLKHDGALLGHTAKYVPGSCEKSLREIAQKALRG